VQIKRERRHALRLAINAQDKDLDASIAFCRAAQVGLEITTFAFAENLDRELDLRTEYVRQRVAGIVPLASHGPFHDLVTTSRDREIVAVCQRRHKAALEASWRVGASVYVGHTNFTPLIRNKSYRELFIQRALKFWLPLADEAGKRGLQIVLENLWEEGPELQRALIDQAAHPHLRACFDNGHALVFSKRSSAEWVETLGPALTHCHLHDNDGTADEHKPAGQGIENWPALLTALTKHAPQALLVAESDRVSDDEQSLAHFRRVMPG
jgi:sugar phosphate isomerase/epimerase